MPATAIVKPGQCLLDVAIQHCGSADAALALAALNGISLTASLLPGTLLALPAAVWDKKVVQWYAANNAVPARGIEATPEGVGFWLIGVDFIVS